MALYQNGSYLQQSKHQAFDVLHNPGDTPPNSGIYRCEGCAREISHNVNNTLPPQNHHQHTTAQGAIRWRMIVYSETKKGAG